MKKSFLQRIAGGIAKRAAKFAGIPLRDPALVALLGRTPASSGIDVDEAKALNFSAVWCAVNLISGTVASLPINVYKRSGKGFEEVLNHPIARLLQMAPNVEMTPFIFFETLQAHMLTYGNCYAKIERDTDGNIVNLWPVMPNQIEPNRTDDGKLCYEFHAHYEGEQDETIFPEDLLHVPGLGFDGIRGYGVIELARDSVGLGLACEEHGGRFFGNGSVPGGIIEHPTELGEQGIKNLRESWEQVHRGVDQSNRIAILEEGASYKTVGLSPEDSQFLQTRQFQVIEIARWFNIPPHMLRDLSNASFSNIEHQGIDFLTYTLRPWLIKWCQEINRKLFRPAERMAFSVSHNTHELLQTDGATRFQMYQTGRYSGIFTLNDILRRERMKPIDGPEGDVRLMPENMSVFGPHSVPAVDDNGQLASTDPRVIQDTALDGGQINSLMQIIQAVSANQIKPDSAVHIVQIAFPNVDPEQIKALLKPYQKGLN
jgi:HK97 family phage portal protein